jgi:hypothetical protein
MIPINISNEKFGRLASTFNCAKGTFPFTYLGLPLSLVKPNLSFSKHWLTKYRTDFLLLQFISHKPANYRWLMQSFPLFLVFP